MTFIAQPLEERETCFSALPNVASFESLPYPVSSPWDPQTPFFPIDGLSIDNTALRSLSKQTWNQPLNSSADGLALPSSGYVCACYPICYPEETNNTTQDFQMMGLSPAALVNTEDLTYDHTYRKGDRYEKSTSPIQSDDMTQSMTRDYLPMAKSDITEFRSESLPNLRPNPEDEAIREIARRKRAHTVIEKRYRESLNLSFLQLRDVLSKRRPKGYKGMSTDKRPERGKRGAILAHARDDILELRAELKSIKEKFSTLRDATFPNTCKFTLNND